MIQAAIPSPQERSQRKELGLSFREAFKLLPCLSKPEINAWGMPGGDTIPFPKKGARVAFPLAVVPCRGGLVTKGPQETTHTFADSALLVNKHQHPV